MDATTSSRVRTWLVVAVLVGAVIFALVGGQYTTLDLVNLKGELKDQQEAIAQLKSDIDSLSKVAQASEHDPRTQERLARDQFGMIRSGEYLYRIVPSGDSGR